MKSRRAEKQNRDGHEFMVANRGWESVLPDFQTRQKPQESGLEGGADLPLDQLFGETIAIGRRDQKEAVLTD